MRENSYFNPKSLLTSRTLYLTSLLSQILTLTLSPPLILFFLHSPSLTCRRWPEMAAGWCLAAGWWQASDSRGRSARLVGAYMLVLQGRRCVDTGAGAGVSPGIGATCAQSAGAQTRARPRDRVARPTGQLARAHQCIGFGTYVP